MATKTLDQLNADIFKALTDNSVMLGDWISRLGEDEPYKALMTFDKITGTFIKLNELDLTGKGGENISINIEVASSEGKAILSKLLQEDENTDD